ncbi:MAG: hypothetical protein ABSC38_05615 [Verrucomicrobiia bacterium]
MKPRSALTLVITLCASGVFTIAAMAPLRAGQAESNVAQNLAIIDERLKQLSQQIEALQFDQQQMQKQIIELQAQVVELHRTGTVSATDTQALEAKIKASDAAREKDKQIILDAVAKEIAAISGHTSGGSATPPPTDALQVGQKLIVSK